MGSRWLRLGMLAAGCVLLAAGVRLFYLIYCGDPSPEISRVPKRVVRTASGRERALPSSEIPDEDLSSGLFEASVPTPSPPSLSIITEQLPMGVVGSDYSQALELAGAGGPVIWTIAAGDLPPGLELSAEGIISGIPEEAGEWRFTVGLLMPGGSAVRKELRLLIREASTDETGELKIITESLLPARLGRNYLLKLEAEGGATPYLWYLEDGELPEGIYLNSASGVIFGLPREPGNFEFTVSIFDEEKAFAIRDYTLRVEEGGVEIVTAALPPAVKDERYSLTLRARGGVVPYTWQLIDGHLPEGLEFDPDRGTIAGVPGKWETMEFSIRVTDRKGGWDVREFELAMGVIESGGLRIVTGTLPAAVLGEVYQVPLEANGGEQPYLWTVTAGDLPPSLFLDAETGEIGGLPEMAGKSHFTVMVSDSQGRTARQELDLVVDHQVVYITIGSLPDAVAGEEYKFLLEATGGAPPYFFSLELGYLPNGLSLAGASGLIEGIVSDIYLRQGDQDFSFRVMAVDQDGQEDIAELPLKVIDPLGPLLAAVDGRAPSPRPVPSVTPAGSEDAISNLIGAVSDAKIGLAWRNPIGEDFAEVRVVRKTAGYPRDPGDGVVIYAGRGDNLVDAGLKNRRAYFYAVIPYSRDGYPGGIGARNRISLTPRAVSLFGENDPYVDEVVNFLPLGMASQNPAIALGPPSGRGRDDYSREVVSLHARSTEDAEAGSRYGGTIILKFNDNIVVNDSGVDFTVFENASYPNAGTERWMEPAVVAVSQDGEDWREFPFSYSYRYDEGNDDGINFSNPYSYQYGFAGISPVFSNQNYPDPTNPAVSGGDSFDLDDLPGRPFTWIQYVRITSTGDRWLRGNNGVLVRHTDYRGSLSGTASSGFDLDAVCAVNY
jgi:hypothetical protein